MLHAPPQAAGDSILQQAYPPTSESLTVSHTATAGGVTVSSDKEAGGEEHSEIAPVQTHQRQCGRLEGNTAPASDRTAVAFRPIRYQIVVAIIAALQSHCRCYISEGSAICWENTVQLYTVLS